MTIILQDQDPLPKNVIISTNVFFFKLRINYREVLWIFRQIYDNTHILKENPCSVSNEGNILYIYILLLSNGKNQTILLH